MTCQEITILISIQSALSRLFEDKFREKNAAEVKRIYKEIKNGQTEFYKAYPKLEEEFFQKFEQPPYDIKMFSHLADNDTLFNHWEPIVNKFVRKGYSIQKWNYHHFQMMLGKVIEKNDLAPTRNTIAALNSLFLSLFPSQERFTIKSSELHPSLQREFGRFLRGGKIKIDTLKGMSAFREMAGGDIEIEKVSYPEIENEVFVGLGRDQHGGRIRINNAKVDVGQFMHSGTISVNRMAQGRLAQRADGGTIFVKKYLANGLDINKKEMAICWGAVGGTFVIGEIESSARSVVIGSANVATVLVKCKKNQINYCPPNGMQSASIAYFDEEKDRIGFVGSPHGMKEEDEGGESLITHAMMNWILRIKTPEIARQINYNLLEGGILILNNVTSLTDIGKGQKGGVILIDDTTLTYEETCQRVSADRPGGIVIYLRKWEEKTSFLHAKRRAEFMEIK